MGNYREIILDAWEYSNSTEILAPSQLESVICLLDIKGKDRRIINNLRPITLSNCDLKFITKTYTTRLNKVLVKIIHPSQTAYIANRQVHDCRQLTPATEKGIQTETTTKRIRQIE